MHQASKFLGFWLILLTAVASAQMTVSGNTTMAGSIKCLTGPAPPPVAATPTFAPVAGSYSGTQTVAISASTGPVICYNTTGSPATNGTTGCTTGTHYTGLVSVSASETLYAVAGGTGFTDSAVGRAAYTISSTGLPVFSPSSYSGAGPVSVTISCTGGKTPFYRTDGGPVTIASKMYASPIAVSSTTTIVAICATIGGTPSAPTYQTNGQADLPSAVCYTISGATETGNGTPCSHSGGGIGTLAFASVNWNVASTATITATTQATAASSTQLLAEHLYSGSADPAPPKCDNCTSMVQDFVLKASAGNGTFENIETDMPQYDATHNANRQNGWQCNQYSNYDWEADAGSGSGGLWSDSGIPCSYAAGIPKEVVLRTTHSNSDTSCGGNGVANYTDLWDNGVHHDLTTITWGHCQGYGPNPGGYTAWGFQDQPDFKPTSGTALTGTLTLSSATVAMGYGDESTSNSGTYTITMGGAATPLLEPNNYVTGNNALATPSPVLAFGKQGTSTSSPAIPISISNPSNAQYCSVFGIGCGTGSVTVTSMAISGTNAGDFTLTGTCSAIASGADCEPTIKFTPTATANTNETAVFTVNYSGATVASQTMSLTGTSATVTSLSTSSCPTTLSGSTNYQHGASITCGSTTFNIASSGIDENLDGFSSIFGNTSSASQVNAIAFTGSNAVIVLHNGTVATGAGTNTNTYSGNLSSVIGPTGGFTLSPTTASSFFNLTFNYNIQYANAISDNGGLILFHDNKVNDTAVGNCSSPACRSVLQGAPIYQENVSGVTSGATQIYNNFFNGSPQGGVNVAAPGAIVSDNTINPGNATGNNTNDFCMWAWGNNVQVHHNVCGWPQTSTSNTRGIQISAAAVSGVTGIAVYNNLIYAIETPTNSEYGSPGCQHGGTYGIQFDDNPGGSNAAYSNNVTVYAMACPAQALRFTDVENLTDVSHDNTYTASVLSGATTCTSIPWQDAMNGCAYAFGIDSTYGATSLRDTFAGDNGDIFIGPDGSPGTSGGVQIQSPTFNKGSNPGSFWHFLVAQNGPTSSSSQVANMHVIDPTYGPGVSFTDDWIYAQGSNTGPVSVYEDWTQTMTVTKTSGPAAVGAVVTWTDTLSNTYTCTTNSSGVCTVKLTQYRDNNDTGANQVENRNPYSLSIPLAGCTTFTSSGVTISATGSRSITLSGC